MGVTNGKVRGEGFFSLSRGGWTSHRRAGAAGGAASRRCGFASSIALRTEFRRRYPHLTPGQLKQLVNRRHWPAHGRYFVDKSGVMAIPEGGMRVY